MGTIVLILLVTLVVCAAIIIAAVASGATQKDTKSVMVFTFFGSTATAIVIAGITLYDLAKLWLGFAPYPVDIPLYPWWPENLTVDAKDGLALESTALTSLHIEASSLPLSAKLLFSISTALNGLMHTWLALAIRSMALHYLRGSAFRPIVTKIIHHLAWVVFLCGLFAPILHSFAVLATGDAITGAGFDRAPAELGDNFTLPTTELAIPIPIWPIGAFLALFVLSAVLKDGEKLEETTEGLV